MRPSRWVIIGGAMLLGLSMIFGLFNPIPAYCLGIGVGGYCVGAALNFNPYLGLVLLAVGVIVWFRSRRR